MIASTSLKTIALLAIAGCLFASSSVSAANIVLYRVNAGRDSSYTDTSGIFWDVDTNYISSNTTNSVSSSTAIAGAVDATIYRTERNGATYATQQQLRYVFAVNAQTTLDDEFQIRLHAFPAVVILAFKMIN
jgi:Malectin domain